MQKSSKHKQTANYDTVQEVLKEYILNSYRNNMNKGQHQPATNILQPLLQNMNRDLD